MQLTARSILLDAEPTDDGGPAPRNPSLDEYEARRCHVCGARYPSFGFGPPLTRMGVVIWACSAHRDEVNRRLSGPANTATRELDQQPPDQLPLF
jgi:hypothetical protein